eukprot:evm.model.scf_15EXC.10 EVM.evm.TU.scf_15EXC.10   scf_15EXC:211924-213192(-)
MMQGGGRFWLAEWTFLRRRLATRVCCEGGGGRAGRMGPASTPQRLESVLGALRELGMTEGQAATAVSHHPGLLSYKNTGKWAERALAWKALLGISEQSELMKDLARRPAALTMSGGNLWKNIALLEQEGCSMEVIRGIIGREPVAASMSTESLRAKMGFLCGLGVPREKLPGILSACPKVLALSMEKNLKPTIDWLSKNGLRKSDISAVLQRFPRMLTYSTDNNLNPTVTWLVSMGVRGDALVTVLRRFPQLLGCSVDNKLKPAAEWLASAGLTGGVLASVIRKCPGELGCSLEKLTANHEYLSGIGIKGDELVKIYRTQPTILTLALKGPLMQQKIKFIEQIMGMIPRDVITKHPPIIGYSLEKRLRPRFLFLAHIGHPVSFQNLTSAFTASDASFRKRGLLLTGGHIDFLEFCRNLGTTK